MNLIDYLFENSKQLDKDLIVGKPETVSYRETYQQVLNVAHFLKNEVSENEKVLLISDNSSFMVVAYLAIIKSGNVVVPLDPNVSHDSLNHIIKTCQPQIAFIQQKYASNFNDFSGKIVTENDFDKFPGLSESEITSYFSDSNEFDQSRLAEILFTSGSTALPKGVMLSHENIIENTKSITQYLHLTRKDRMEVVLPFYYCYGLSLLHTHIRVGGSMVFNNRFMFLNTVVNDIKKYDCTGFAGVPSHFQMLLRKLPSFREMKFPALRYVTQAGGKLADPFIVEFTNAFPEVDFFVMYGQTEATARLSYLPPEMLKTKLGSMGKGIPGVMLEVLTNDGIQVKLGEIGEIVASGKNIMQGYLNDPELTAQTLHDGKLHTGDLAIVDDDGYIFIVAREKEFIKVGGERISPKEIEKTISTLNEVVDCSIIGVEDELLGEALKALIVLRENSGQHEIEEKIKMLCAEKLGFQKVPKYYEFLDKIPMAKTGKKKASVLKEFA